MWSSIVFKSIKLLVFLGILEVHICTSFEVIIDTKEQLDAIGADDTCTYTRQFPELCKTGPRDLENAGFWSSCGNSNCEISIKLGELGSNTLPNEVNIFTYVNGNNAQIRLRYRLTPDSQIINIFPDLPNSADWINSNYDLTKINGLNKLSVLIIRMSSGVLLSNADIIDNIVFTFPDEKTTSEIYTTAKSETTEITESESLESNSGKSKKNYRKQLRN